MLVLKRKQEESIDITINGVRANVKILRWSGDGVTLGITAPPEVTIHRSEIQQRVDRENGND